MGVMREVPCELDKAQIRRLSHLVLVLAVSRCPPLGVRRRAHLEFQLGGCIITAGPPAVGL